MLPSQHNEDPFTPYSHLQCLGVLRTWRLYKTGKHLPYPCPLLSALGVTPPSSLLDRSQRLRSKMLESQYDCTVVNYQANDAQHCVLDR